MTKIETVTISLTRYKELEKKEEMLDTLLLKKDDFVIIKIDKYEKSYHPEIYNGALIESNEYLLPITPTTIQLNSHINYLNLQINNKKSEFENLIDIIRELTNIIGYTLINNSIYSFIKLKKYMIKKNIKKHCSMTASIESAKEWIDAFSEYPN